MLDLVEIVTSLENNEDTHLARILVLLLAFYEPNRAAVEGITKLAKLDFLLRYPGSLKKALIAKGVSEKSIPVDDFEAQTIEARMVRYRYGPWDHRYRQFLNILVGRGLVSVELAGPTIKIDLTDSGAELAKTISENDEFQRIMERAKLLKKHLDLRARKLMEFIYDVFPELTSLEYNEGIEFRGGGHESRN